ncbi:elongation of very long chain fatty acids protein 4 [Trichonephila clavata]|uniref:Elongation of very long chain fatty acids protein n=1 Tax=Trichonephila clavata TaxID=2740835 RepID=A0A8X6FQ48_TRICU|nr:elongation of very long chain fatty acids protein 4 [Trichonephila clavata]
MVLRQVYDFLFTTEFERKGLVSNVEVPVPIIIAYLLFVLWIGPAYMKSRKPYNLKVLLILYNFLQTIFNGYVFYEGFSGLVNFWSMRCMIKKNPNVDLFLMAISMAFWHYYLLKYLDLLDTVFFVLRKKYNQITFLHVGHHAGFCLILNTSLPYVHKAAAFYILLAFTINSGIHVIMYTYYGLAAFGSRSLLDDLLNDYNNRLRKCCDWSADIFQQVHL